MRIFDENFHIHYIYWRDRKIKKNAKKSQHLGFVYPIFVPNLIILSQVVAEKSLTEDLQMHYKGVRDGKINKSCRMTA